MTMKTNAFYGLRDARNGNLVRLGTHVEERYAPARYVLSSNPRDPVFKLTSAEAVAFVLMEDTSTYNSSEECPGWGEYDVADLEIVKVTETVQMEKMEVLAPLTYRVREMPRRLPRQVLNMYLKGRVLDEGVTFATMGMVTLANNQSFEDAKAYEGQTVYPENNKFGGRKLLLSLPVPSDYAESADMPNVALFVFED